MTVFGGTDKISKRVKTNRRMQFADPGTFQQVAENDINETVKAVPAFVDGKMILRKEKNLVVIE